MSYNEELGRSNAALAAILEGVKALPPEGGLRPETVEYIDAQVAQALAQAKESGEFDGPQGPQGEKGDTGAIGPQGPQGNPGADGKTPVKGEDYYTAAEREELVQAVAAALPRYAGGVS